jgi:hypothetical protein
VGKPKKKRLERKEEYNRKHEGRLHCFLQLQTIPAQSLPEHVIELGVNFL